MRDVKVTASGLYDVKQHASNLKLHKDRTSDFFSMNTDVEAADAVTDLIATLTAISWNFVNMTSCQYLFPPLVNFKHFQ